MDKQNFKRKRVVCSLLLAELFFDCFRISCRYKQLKYFAERESEIFAVYFNSVFLIFVSLTLFLYCVFCFFHYQ
jgi:hypothetical protein